MSSNGNSTGSNNKSAITQPVSPSLACVATAMERVQVEIDDLWRDCVKRDNLYLSERLVEVSHALQRAARLLGEDRAIG